VVVLDRWERQHLQVAEIWLIWGLELIDVNSWVELAIISPREVQLDLVVDRVCDWNFKREVHDLLVRSGKNVLLHYATWQNLYWFVLGVLNRGWGASFLGLEHVQVVIGTDVEVGVTTVNSNWVSAFLAVLQLPDCIIDTGGV